MQKTNSTTAGVSPARRAAFDVLNAIERGPAHSDDLLRGKAVESLLQADRNLATALVLGVLRWQIWLDYQIRPLLKRPGAKLDVEVRVALRLGAFQLLFLDRVPAHAAIDESVELAKQSGHHFAAGMVNAVLRKLAARRVQETLATGDKARFDAAVPPARLKPHSFKAEKNASTESMVAQSDQAASSVVELDPDCAHPAWMVERWRRAYGADAARTICACGQRQPSATVRLAGCAVEAELADAGIELAPGELLRDVRRVVSGDVTATAAFRAGRVRLQDEGSQLVGEIAACMGDCGARKPARIADLCAAPGGKTLILAERNPQATIVACEMSAARLAALRERLAILGERVECRLLDAASFDHEAEFDLVLADVPCSGTGTLGRNPEIRHRLREEDLARQSMRQRSILRAALRAVRPGGRVVYSTCSLEAEENEQVVAAEVAEDPRVIMVPIEQCFGALESQGVLVAGAATRLRECLTPQGTLRLMPGVFGTDGFFVALLQRSA